MPAVSLAEASDDYSGMAAAAVANSAVETLHGHLNSFLNAVAVAIPGPGTVAQRTVTNWIPIGSDLLRDLSAVKANEDKNQAFTVGNYLSQICKASQFALSAGRITSAQGTAILAAFNLYWPA